MDRHAPVCMEVPFWNLPRVAESMDKGDALPQGVLSPAKAPPGFRMLYKAIKTTSGFTVKLEVTFFYFFRM